MAGKKVYDDRADITLRVERDLLEEMRRAALRDDRSLNSFVVASVRRQIQGLVPELTKRPTDQPRKPRSKK